MSSNGSFITNCAAVDGGKRSMGGAYCGGAEAGDTAKAFSGCGATETAIRTMPRSGRASQMRSTGLPLMLTPVTYWFSSDACGASTSMTRPEGDVMATCVKSGASMNSIGIAGFPG